VAAAWKPWDALVIDACQKNGLRVDSYGNVVSKRSPGNHTPIAWDW